MQFLIAGLTPEFIIAALQRAVEDPKQVAEIREGAAVLLRILEAI